MSTSRICQLRCPCSKQTISWSSEFAIPASFLSFIQLVKRAKSEEPSVGDITWCSFFGWRNISFCWLISGLTSVFMFSLLYRHCIGERLPFAILRLLSISVPETVASPSRAYLLLKGSATDWDTEHHCNFLCCQKWHSVLNIKNRGKMRIVMCPGSAKYQLR